MVREIYVLHVTKLCNCACTYCYEQDKTSTYTWEEVKSMLDDIINGRTSNEFSIEFLGGEPMLAWDYIKNTIDYIDTMPELNVNFMITTNGTIVNDELFEYLKRDNLDYCISLDGHRYANIFRIMKATKKNNFEIVMENIKALQEHGYNPGIHITSHLYNVACIKESCIYLYNKGIRDIDVGTVEGFGTVNDEYMNRFIYELDEVSKLICDGTMPDLHIGLFGWVKPKDDIRTYVYDSNGKLVAESYGRSGDDFINKYAEEEGYVVKRCDNSTETSNNIYYIRSTVYRNHHKRLGDFDTCEFRHVFDE